MKHKNVFYGYNNSADRYAEREMFKYLCWNILIMSFIIKKAMAHAFYVGGLTFFSTLSLEITSGIVMAELTKAAWVSFVTTGISFFTSMVIQSSLDINELTARYPRNPRRSIVHKQTIKSLQKKTSVRKNSKRYKLLRTVCATVHGYRHGS